MKHNTQRTTRIALLTALVIVLQFVAAIIPPIGGFSISLVLIPIVVGAAVYGAKVGMLLGGAFGVVAIINCITGLDGGGHMVFQASPFLCILVVMVKGIAAGLCAGLVYRLLKNKNAYLAMLCSAIVCPVVNTGIFIACMLTFFPSVLSQWAKGGNIIVYIFSTLLVFNFVPELLINIVFSPASARLVKRVKQ